MCGSCSLDEYNPSGATPENEWTSAAGYEQLVNGCYFDLVRLVYGQAEDTYVIQSEGGTDIWQAAPKASGNWQKALTYSGFGPDVSMFFEGYCGFYSTVNQCNAAIGYVDKVKGLDDNKKKALAAEAHFLRAHALFNIVEYYGGKYLPLDPIVNASLTSLPTSSINDFYKVIIEDCKYAIDNLPATVAKEKTGHVTKAAAYHLYAKACMTYATYTDGKCGATPVSETEAKQLLTDAKNAAVYLIENASSMNVKLYDTPAQMFDENNNKSNAEALFVVTHSTVTALNPRGNYFNRVWKHFGAYTNDASYIYLEGITPDYNTKPRLAKCNGYIEPSKKFLDMFGEKDTRYNAFFQDTYYVNKASKGKTGYEWTAADCKRYGLDESRAGKLTIELGDTAIYLSRKAMTKAQKEATRYAVYNLDDNYADETKPGGFYPSLKKQDCPSLYAGTNASKPYSAADCIVYRLGETYLLAAEAAWRLGDNATALKYINVIRNRACKDHDNSMNLSGNITKDQLLDEYALEMCGEWCRWQTLKRFRAFESRLKAFNPQCAGNFQDLYYVRPINTSEILTITNPGEYQTEGY